MTGPATPKPAATTGSDARCGAASRENSFTIRSNCANSLLANRLRKTGDNAPFFSENSARLHFVPPTSPARITEPLRRYCRWTVLRRAPARSRVVPPSSATLEQKLRFPRPPAPCRILRHARCLRRAPHVQNRIDQRPRRLHAVPAVKQRRIPPNAIAQQCRVRAARSTIAKRVAIAEIHRHVPDPHLRPRPLRSKRNTNPFVRLDIQHQPVVFHLALAKHNVRRALELNHDLRTALRQPLTGAQIKRHSRPPPVVDLQF